MASRATGELDRPGAGLTRWQRACLVGAYFEDQADSPETRAAEHALRKKGYMEETARKLTPLGMREARRIHDEGWLR